MGKYPAKATDFNERITPAVGPEDDPEDVEDQEEMLDFIADQMGYKDGGGTPTT